MTNMRNFECFPMQNSGEFSELERAASCPDKRPTLCRASPPRRTTVNPRCPRSFQNGSCSTNFFPYARVRDSSGLRRKATVDVVDVAARHRAALRRPSTASLFLLDGVPSRNSTERISFFFLCECPGEQVIPFAFSTMDFHFNRNRLSVCLALWRLE